MAEWHSGRMLLALVRHFDAFTNTLMPEWDMGGRADLIVISKARYVTEIEIKISVADWKADRHKRKWNPEARQDRDFVQRRGHIARFFYAIPETLESKVPALLPEGAGILIVRSTEYGDTVSILREATRQKATPLPAESLHHIFVACYYRYWRMFFQLERWRRHAAEMRRAL